MTHDIVVSVDTRWATAWVRLMAALRFVVGAERAGRWAVWGAYRFARVRVGAKR